MINPVYLQEETQTKLRSHYLADKNFPSVSLTQLLTKEAMERVLNEVIDLEFIPDISPLSHRRSTADQPASLVELLTDDSFREVISSITGQELPIPRSSIFKYSHRDYQIINDEMVDPPGMDLILDLTPEWHQEMGGYVAYTDGEGQLYSLPPGLGTLSVVDRADRYYRYVKYVNVNAGNLSRYLFFAHTEVGSRVERYIST